MADSMKAGLGAALADVSPGDRPPVDEGEQMDLLGLPATVAGLAAVARRGPGRPPGARNKRTEEWAEYLLGRYGSPLEMLAQFLVRPIDELRGALGCSAFEAWQEKRLVAGVLAPYLHQRQAVAVDVSNRQAVHLTIITEGVASSATALEAIDVQVVDIVNNQELADGGPGDVAQSDVARSQQPVGKIESNGP